ncbi:leucyl aminopeptidase [Paenibacillus tianmuensis]|uniref:Probable cytosol aminopeptidase n=1 Tax=Paenibacillus tianmuensis TaxID=624147 RepID=A0A1G4PX74_9BACL|nr:leucyl aminopeptidase family protein [Paenibacillus tianmuensis]SCW36775.1 leucyl aminopeptidase [Paenibacillus tianmuensis]
MKITTGFVQTADVTVYLCPEHAGQPVPQLELRPTMKARGAVTWFYGRGEEAHVLILGLGPEARVDAERLREAAGNAARAVHKEGFATVNVMLESFVRALNGALSEEEAVRAWAEGWLLGSYAFDKYKSRKEARTVERLHLVCASEASYEEALEQTAIRTEGAMFARDLCNEPPNVLHPESLVEMVRERFAERPVNVRVYGEQELADLGMNGLLTVAQGSRYKPALIELTFCTDPSQPLLALVGKGITFDMGGMNVKSGRDISDARFDMGGSCAVLGAMDMISRSELQANIVALIAVADNMPDAAAFVPSTVVTYPNGLSVQVGNTDAEGRLVLADALLHAGRLGAREVIDIATLTGNVGEALGLSVAGAWGDRKLVETLTAIGETNGDRLWPMPLVDDYEELLRSDYADMNNIPPISYGGAIVAALFLRRFVAETMRWVHIDMANTVQAKAARGYYPAGATGYGARLLADFAVSRAEANRTAGGGEA